jgi:hypothetical protein
MGLCVLAASCRQDVYIVIPGMAKQSYTKTLRFTQGDMLVKHFTLYA